jgi:hypothetical protein
LTAILTSNDFPSGSVTFAAEMDQQWGQDNLIVLDVMRPDEDG